MNLLVTRLFGLFAAIEIKHWTNYRKSFKNIRSIQRYLVKDNLTTKELISVKNLMNQYNMPGFPNDKLINNIYNQCTTAQARLIDIQQDTDILMVSILQIIRRTPHEVHQESFIRDILEDVIINKTLTHEAGRESIAKGISHAQRMNEFLLVLTRLIDRWEIAD